MKVVLAVCLAAAALVEAQTGKGSIAGRVVDAKTLKPVAAAVVMAVMDGAVGAGGRTKSGADGSYRVEGLAAGRYAICVQAGDGYLDPCEWERGAATVGVVAGQAVDGVTIRLGVAAVVAVDLLDAQDVLGQRMAEGRRPAISLGVWGPQGLYHPARAVGQAAVGGEGPMGQTVYRYQVGAPREVDLVLELGSGDVRLGDAAGVALAGNGSRTAFRQANAEVGGKRFTFTVVGWR